MSRKGKAMNRQLPCRGGWKPMSVVAALAALLVFALPALAGDLTRAQVEQRVHPPLRLGEKLQDVPVWPITSELEPDAGPVAFIFESIDLAPLPGFEGTPFNLLISVDRKGNFMDVEVLRQHEPVFLGGLGEGPLREFVRQYAGRNVKQNFAIASPGQRGPSGGSQVALDGIAKATASIRIVNQTVLASALAVARAKLGFAGPGQQGPAARVREDLFEPLDFAGLLRAGMVARLTLTNGEAEKLFAGTEGAGADPEALARPEEPLVDLYVAYLNPPTIGRTLLGDAAHAALMGKLEDGRQAFWIGAGGRYPVVDEGFVPGGVPRRLSLRQNGLALELRELVSDPVAPPGAPALQDSHVFTVYAGAGLDPGQPIELVLDLVRSKGIILPTVVVQPVSLPYAPPARLFDYPPRPLPDWLLAWKNRWADLALVGAALALLAAVLARPRWISAEPRRLAWFRRGFLGFTLVHLGWIAQGQLSIVQVTGAVKSLAAGQGLGSFLYDPVSLLLIAFTLASFLLWGRGAFCGWLCPFGALQEIVGALGRRLGLPQLRPGAAIAARLPRLRYILLAALVAAALLAPRAAESLVELEPFKTSITLGFDRPWPYVAYALGLLLAGAFYFKFFCRVLCPLGAAMTLGGKLRRIPWLPRRAECGKPCQTCRARCEYDAIAPGGEIRYDDCFQCLDCVGVYHDGRRCAPLLLYRKKGLVMTPAGVLRGPAADHGEKPREAALES